MVNSSGIKRINFFLCIVILSLLFVLIFCGNGESVKIPLIGMQSKALILNSATPSKEVSFEIDSSSLIVFTLLSDYSSLSITLFNPDGKEIKKDNIELIQGTYIQYTIDSSLNTYIPTILSLPGTKYILRIPSPTPGTWILKIEASNLQRDIGVFLSLFIKNSIKASILTNYSEYKLDDVVIINVVLNEGSNPLSGANVSAVIMEPLNIDPDKVKIVPLSIELKDDGMKYDALQNDGIYTGSTNASIVGEFTANATITGKSSKGENFIRTVSTLFYVNEELANFIKIFSDTGIDANNNGLIDRVQFISEINVTKPGKYNLNVTFTGSNNISNHSNTIVELDKGVQNVTVDFTAEDLRVIGVSGPYMVSDIFLEYLGEERTQLADRLSNIWQTQAYQLDSLERGYIILRGNNFDFGIDTNDNGLFDILRVNMEVDLLNAGYYQWSARLVDKDNAEIDFASRSETLNIGENTISVDFKGEKIGAHSVNGPYFVKNLLFFGAGASLIVNDVIQTETYKFVEFESASVVLEPPKAEAGGSYTGITGSPVTFDASGSYDTDGEIVLYEWDWDDNGIYDEAVSLPIITHTWSEGYSGTVRLKITDNDGLSDIDTAEVEIEALQPPYLEVLRMNQTGSTITITFKNTGELLTYNGKITKVTTPRGIACFDSLPVYLNSPIQPGETTTVELHFNTTNRIRFGFEAQWEDNRGNVYNR